MTYECHVTVSTEDAPWAGLIAEDYGWKTSEIARDPVLGMDTYFYLTKHASRYTQMHGLMENLCRRLGEQNIPILRKKIEHIIFDTKSGDI